MDRHDDTDRDRETMESTVDDGETHATTGGAAAAGAVTGGVIGLAGGPLGAAIGAVGGAIVGAASERMMHSDDDRERARAGMDNDHDKNPLIEDRSKEPATGEFSRPTGESNWDTTAGAAAASTTGAWDRSTETTGKSWDTTTGSAERMQLREEELTARTTPVQTGQVSIGKEVVSEQRTVEVPVTREEVFVERKPVGRQPTDAPIDDTTNRTIDVPVTEERVTVEKQPVVYEEIGIGKREVTDTKQVSETVRREEARIENEGEVNLRRDEA